MISVVIPAYNCAGQISESVSSCLSQQMEDELEVIVVDDASTDGTLQALDAFSYDCRVRVLEQDRNRGPGACRNKAMQQAVGEYIALLDADDQMLPGRLRAQLEAFERCGSDLALCSTWTVEKLPSGRTKRINKYHAGKRRQSLMRRIFLGHISAITPTLTFRRADALAVGGFDEALVYREDSDFILKLLELGAMKVIEQPLVIRQIRKEGLSTQVDAQSFLSSRSRFAENAIGRFPFLERSLGLYWARAHYILARKIGSSDPARCRKLLYQSLRERPTVKATAALMAAYWRLCTGRQQVR